MYQSTWQECPDCGLLQHLPPPKPHCIRVCVRCRRSFGDGVNRAAAARALVLTALLLFLMANFSPFMGLQFSGRESSIHLGSGIESVADYRGLLPIALFVLAVSILAPLARIVALGLVLFGLERGEDPQHLANLLHFADRVRPWAMLDVVLIGALITLTKVHDLASVTVGAGFYMLGLLVIVLALMEITIDRFALWQRIHPSPAADAVPQAGWQCCSECGMVQQPGERCVRCGHRLYRRKPDSLQRTAALVLTGFILYLPANLYPVLTVISFGKGEPSTIIDGVLDLLQGRDWPLAAIVFVASILVPLLKLFGLGLLVASARWGSIRALVGRTRLYRLIELVGRWSSVDIVVAALLTALVTLGNLATVEPGVGVLAFGGVVLVTMVATDLFDPRLIWDAAGENDG